VVGNRVLSGGKLLHIMVTCVSSLLPRSLVSQAGSSATGRECSSRTLPHFNDFLFFFLKGLENVSVRVE
jgi:hypothetical protein